MSAGINAIAAAGAVPHVRMIDVVFRNPDVDTGTVPETVWPRVAANDTLVTLHGHGLLIGPNADL